MGALLVFLTRLGPDVQTDKPPEDLKLNGFSQRCITPRHMAPVKVAPGLLRNASGGLMESRMGSISRDATASRRKLIDEGLQSLLSNLMKDLTVSIPTIPAFGSSRAFYPALNPLASPYDLSFYLTTL
jgi:hypothetical protein